MWFCCPICASYQDIDTKSVWNNEHPGRIGLEVFASYDYLGYSFQEVMGIMNCPEHNRMELPYTIQKERQKEEQRLRLKKQLGHSEGGIAGNEIRGDSS